MGSEGAGGVGAGGRSGGGHPDRPEYGSYIFALLFTEFTNDNSGYVIYH